jgi:trimeric autotransporter adhesin
LSYLQQISVRFGGFIILTVLFCFAAPTAHGEVQSTIALTAPSPTPGGSGSFTASQSSGPAASASGTAYDTYAGVRRYVISSGSGRYASLSGAERYGLLFDNFQIVQSFLTSNQFTLVSSASSCPSSPTTYTWIKVRFRTPDATRDPMSANSTAVQVGGVAVYDSTQTYDFTGASYFDLAGPTLTTTSYGIDRLSSACSSGSMVNASASNTVWDSYGNTLFGSENFVHITEHGNPQVLIGAPQVTLVSGDFSALYQNVLPGILTVFNSRTTQTRTNITLVPDSAGTTFTIRESTSLNDPFTYSSYGTLTCTSMNSPTDGFCSGTLTLTSEGGSGKAVCQLSSPGSRILLACAAQRPNDNTKFVSILAATSPVSVAASIPDVVASTAAANPPTPPEITVSVKNMTGRKITSMGQPSNSSERPQPPFAYKGGTYPGTGGTCSSTLDGFASCNVVVTYAPTSLAMTAQTFRQEYDNGSSTVQATGNIRGVAGISSITVTPGTTSYNTGDAQQFTATATFSDTSTQDVSSLVDWSATNLTVAPIGSTGSVTFAAPGSADISASVAGVNSNAVTVTAAPGPATVVTSTSALATADNSNRKVFYDSVNDRHWAFYYTGSAIGWSYSSDDGATWTADSTLAHNTSNFDVKLKVISGTTYVLLAVENSFSISFYRGVCGASLITWDSIKTWFAGTSTVDRYIKPAVGFGANNFAWVAAFYDEGNARQDRYRAIAKPSTGAVTSSPTAGTAARVGMNLFNAKSLSLMSKTSADMYLAVNEGPAVRTFEYTSSSWKELRTPTTYSSGNYDRWTGTAPATNGTSYSFAYVSDSEIYVGGNFTNFGGNASADRIAKWNGTEWVALGTGLNDYVDKVLIVGSNIYVGGIFSDAGGNTNADRIARFDTSNSTWYSLGSGSWNGEVTDMYNDSVNDYLYVVGTFTDGASNTSCDRVCRWNYTGATWSAVSTGFGANTFAVTGNGTNIFFVGSFVNAGGNASADRVAQWNGSALSALGTGAAAGSLNALHWDGTNLYVGGSSANIGGNASCDSICRWDGSSWSAMGTGVTGTVNSITSIGSNVYLGGNLSSHNYIARFNGTSWVQVGPSGFLGMNDIVQQIGAVGTNVYILSGASRAGNYFTVNVLSRWDESASDFYAVAAKPPIRNRVRAIAEDSNGRVFLGGDFTLVDGNTSGYYGTEFTGSGFSTVTSGFGASVYGIASDTGGNTYFVGEFTNNAGDANMDYIAKFNGTVQSAVGIASGGTINRVVAVNPDGSNIYVGGDFTSFGGIANANYISRYNGSAWNAVGTGLNAYVYSIAGSGSAIYVGGDFTDAGANTSADRIALWNGSSWEALGTGAAAGSVRAILVDGSNVYAGGTFTDMGGNTSADYLAMWNGSSWAAVGTGVNNSVYTLAKDGSGNIWVGGDFTDAGGNTSADYIAKWNGTAFTADGDLGLNGTVDVIKIGASGRVYVGGNFTGFTDNRPAGFFAYRDKVSGLAANATDAEFSAVSDSTGNLMQLSINSSGYAAFDSYDVSTGWQSSTSLSAAASASPCLSLDSSTGDRYAFWRETNTVKYKKYTAATWGSATTKVSSGTNRYLTCDPTYSSAGSLMLLYTSGSGSPYDVKSLLAP